MKNVILLICGVLCSFSVLAASTFDGEDVKLQYKESKEFTAVYKGLSILAQTGKERDSLSNIELKNIADDRAEQVCKYFKFKAAGPYGYAMPWSAPLYLPTNGDLVKVHLKTTLGSGLFDFSIGQAFTTITCLR